MRELMRSSDEKQAFTLVELLVVLAIIAILIGVLMPALSVARAASKRVTCESNMRQLGIALYIYANNNKGWIIPCTDDPNGPGGVLGFGYLWPPRDRWPARVFKFALPDPETNNPADYVPKVLICPEDEAPANGHTYALNNPPAANHCTLGRHNFAGLTVDQVVIAAEKSYHSAHYYLEPNEADYNETLDLVHHGRKHGSNYLFFDSHVETRLPPMQENMDPWTTHGVGVQSIPPSP